jgi:hypothetical protein
MAASMKMRAFCDMAPVVMSHHCDVAAVCTSETSVYFCETTAPYNRRLLSTLARLSRLRFQLRFCQCGTGVLGASGHAGNEPLSFSPLSAMALIGFSRADATTGFFSSNLGYE